MQTQNGLGVDPRAAQAAAERQKQSPTAIGGTGLSDLQNAQDKATLAASQGSPNALQLAQDLEKKKRAVRERNAAEEAAAQGRVKAAGENAYNQAVGQGGDAPPAGPPVQQPRTGSPGVTKDLLNRYLGPKPGGQIHKII